MSDADHLTDSLLAAIPEAALLLDTKSDRILLANERAARLLDLTLGAPQPFRDFVGSALPAFVVFLGEIDHRGEAWSRDVALTSAKGQALSCEIRGRRLEEAPHRVLITLMDLAEIARHDRIAAQSELHRGGLSEWQRAQGFFAELERQNQLILNAAGEGIYGVSADGKTTFVNRAAQEMLGWTTEDLLGREIHSLIHHHHLSGEVYPHHDCPIYRSFRFEQVNRVDDEVFWRKDGKPIRVEYVSTPIYDQNVLAGAVVIFRDITERKENERRLHEALEEVAELRDRLEQENAYLQEAITVERAHHDILGTSPAIRQVLARIDLVAETDATVLLTGEAGTGKALVATAIHKASARSGRPLIHFKCGAVPPETLEAELFGQMRGAHAGALRDRPGKLELAHGGTLFLDDVTELPLEHQGKLLQVLQSGAVTRLGDTRARRLDIRLIAATPQDPDREVVAGRLRGDLLMYLNVFPIHCHPLRERHEDIPSVADHLLSLACQRLNRDKPVITEGVMRRLLAYDWPGNVRELRNVMERAAIVSKGGKLIVELGDEGPGDVAAGARVKTEAEMQAEMRANLIACMRETHGRVAGPGGAAEMLGVPATTLYSRLRKHGIDARDWKAPAEA